MTDSTESSLNRRILVIDDNPSIHEDLIKILSPSENDGGASQELAAARAAFFGTDTEAMVAHGSYELDSAYDGQSGLQLAQSALAEGRPYAMAIVDHRMPPGWDGVETVRHLWEADPNLLIVMCTAYSDYSWDQTDTDLGHTDRLLILKKPFEPVEIRQMASALTEKWASSLRERRLIKDLERAETEQRAYAASMETMNRALRSSHAASEMASEARARFISKFADQVGADLSELLNKLMTRDAHTRLEEAVDLSRKLVQTLAQVMDLHYLETGEVVLEKSVCVLETVLTRALDRYRPQAAAKGIDLRLEREGEVPTAIEADARRLEELVSQVVEDAVSRTRRGGVTVRVSNQPTGDWKNSRLILRIEDTGPGLPDEVGGRYYQPFVASEGDAGLGLSIARGLARLMSGKISHEPAPGGGSVFHVNVEVGAATVPELV